MRRHKSSLRCIFEGQFSRGGQWRLAGRNFMPANATRAARSRTRGIIAGNVSWDWPGEEIDVILSPTAPSLAPPSAGSPRPARGTWLDPLFCPRIDGVHRCIGVIACNRRPRGEPTRGQAPHGGGGAAVEGLHPMEGVTRDNRRALPAVSRTAGGVSHELSSVVGSRPGKGKFRVERSSAASQPIKTLSKGRVKHPSERKAIFSDDVYPLRQGSRSSPVLDTLMSQLYRTNDPAGNSHLVQSRSCLHEACTHLSGGCCKVKDGTLSLDQIYSPSYHSEVGRNTLSEIIDQ
ncbi:hypothetical protein KM043_012521 [Ampulex compressa]|nr:hypothetical protein KM043_012521 [Ampulex compressa]